MSSILRKCARTCRTTTTINTPALIPGELKLEEMVVGITQWVTPRPSQLSVTSNMDSTCSAHQHSSNKGPITSEVVEQRILNFICYVYRAWKYSWLTSRALFQGSLHASKHSDINNTPPVMIKLNQNKQNDKI